MQQSALCEAMEGEKRSGSCSLARSLPPLPLIIIETANAIVSQHPLRLARIAGKLFPFAANASDRKKALLRSQDLTTVK